MCNSTIGFGSIKSYTYTNCIISCACFSLFYNNYEGVASQALTKPLVVVVLKTVICSVANALHTSQSPVEIVLIQV